MVPAYRGTHRPPTRHPTHIRPLSLGLRGRITRDGMPVCPPTFHAICMVAVHAHTSMHRMHAMATDTQMRTYLYACTNPYVHSYTRARAHTTHTAYVHAHARTHIHTSSMNVQTHARVRTHRHIHLQPYVSSITGGYGRWPVAHSHMYVSIYRSGCHCLWLALSACVSYITHVSHT